MPQIGLDDIDSQPWWHSRTIIGALVSVGASLAGLWGFNMDPGDMSKLADNLVLIVTAIGAVAAIFGRIWATKTVRKSPIGKPDAPLDKPTAIAKAKAALDAAMNLP